MLEVIIKVKYVQKPNETICYFKQIKKDLKTKQKKALLFC